MLPDFVQTEYWFVPADLGRMLADNKPGAIIHCLPDQMRYIEVEHDRTMYDFIAGQISED